VRNRRSEPRKACVYLIERCTRASSQEIGQLFGRLSYSIAKIVATVLKGLESDKYLRKQIKGLEAEYSFFKGPCFIN
jgi:chromosomal replication initiation ATPase DnaA